MKEVIEQFGGCILQMLTAIVIVCFYFSMLGSGGVLNDVVQAYMYSLCG